MFLYCTYIYAVAGQSRCVCNVCTVIYTAYDAHGIENPTCREPHPVLAMRDTDTTARTAVSHRTTHWGCMGLPFFFWSEG